MKRADSSTSMVYAAEYALGICAADGEACPYPIWQIGRRCAWLAGYHDARTEGFA